VTYIHPAPVHVMFLSEVQTLAYMYLEVQPRIHSEVQMQSVIQR
jgi:hypothetical protein